MREQSLAIYHFLAARNCFENYETDAVQKLIDELYTQLITKDREELMLLRRHFQMQTMDQENPSCSIPFSEIESAEDLIPVIDASSNSIHLGNLLAGETSNMSDDEMVSDIVQMLLSTTFETPDSTS